ncbi:MAG: Dyp-type peroxidase domain-containing protein [Candidatus Binatia bacterium]
MSVPSFVTKVGVLDPRAQLCCTVSFSAEFWAVISLRRRLARVQPSTLIQVAERNVPDTGGDILVYILGKRYDLKANAKNGRLFHFHHSSDTIPSPH